MTLFRYYVVSPTEIPHFRANRNKFCLCISVKPYSFSFLHTVLVAVLLLGPGLAAGGPIVSAKEDSASIPTASRDSLLRRAYAQLVVAEEPVKSRASVRAANYDVASVLRSRANARTGLANLNDPRHTTARLARPQASDTRARRARRGKTDATFESRSLQRRLQSYFRDPAATHAQGGQLDPLTMTLAPALRVPLKDLNASRAAHLVESPRGSSQNGSGPSDSSRNSSARPTTNLANRSGSPSANGFGRNTISLLETNPAAASLSGRTGLQLSAVVGSFARGGDRGQLGSQEALATGLGSLIGRPSGRGGLSSQSTFKGGTSGRGSDGNGRTRADRSSDRSESSGRRLAEVATEFIAAIASSPWTYLGVVLFIGGALAAGRIRATG